MSTASDPTRVGLVSAVPLFQMGVMAAFTGRTDFTVVAVAESAGETSDMIAGAGPNVVLIDADLPGDTAIPLGASLRRSSPALGVVLLGRQSDDLLFRALDAGLSAFVATSARTPTLVAATMHAATAPASFSAPDLAQAVARRDVQRSRLSPRELEVLGLLRDGHTVGRIAAEIGISESTAKTYVARIYDKLGVRSRSEAIAVEGPGGSA